MTPRLLLAAVTGVLAAWAPAGLLPAQQPVPRDSARRTPADSDRLRVTTLAPVRVTVLRTPLPASDAPYAVSVVGPHEAAAARPGLGIDEVLGRIGGVQADNRFNFALGERLVVRGIGARAQFGVRGVRVLLDGIPATFADGQTQLSNVDLGTIGSAEVIRGPASALYGNGAGGVMLLRTATAPAQAVAPRVRALYGSDGLTRIQAGAGGTLGRGSYLVSAGRLDYGGYRAYSAARNAHANAVATYLLGPVALRLVANAVRYDAQNPGGLSDSLLRVDRRQAFAGNLRQRTGEHGSQGQIGATGTAPIGPGELAVSAYALRRSIDNPIPPVISGLQRGGGGARATYGITAGDSGRSLTTVIGAETDLQRDDSRNWVNVRGSRGELTLDQRESVTAAAPFAQVTARAGRLTVLGGVRYDAFRFAAADRLVTASNPDDSGVRRMSALSPSAGASLEIAPALHVYGNFATAFQTPTTTELVNRPDGAGGFNPALGPEHVRSGEVGLKGSLTRLRYDVAAYDMRITDALVPFEVASAPGRQFFRNAGAARHRGLDANLEAVLVRGLVARLSYAMVDARFVSYTADGTSYAGLRVPGVAPRLGTATLDWRHPSGGFVAVEERVQGAIPANDANSARSPGYAVTSLRGALPLGRVSLVGGIGNIFGTRYNTAVTVNAFGGRYYEPAPGRTVYAGLTLNE